MTLGGDDALELLVLTPLENTPPGVDTRSLSDNSLRNVLSAVVRREDPSLSSSLTSVSKVMKSEAARDISVCAASNRAGSTARHTLNCCVIVNSSDVLLLHNCTLLNVSLEHPLSSILKD